ncbi:MAG: hypothetical protein AAF824_13665 [Bacteroidota bacterium]
MTQSFVTVPLQLPYATYGQLSEHTTDVWIACHGYGQLAKHFIKRFDVFSPETHFVIAPQGPSMLYMKNYSVVGASWLTRENREVGIQNYLDYIDTIWEQYAPSIQLGKVKIHALGFSQGVATISRWVVHKHLPVNQLIFWAARYPNEWKRDNIQFLADKTEFVFVGGTEDEFLTDKLVQEEIERFREELGITPKVVRFEGGHIVSREVLASL